MRIVFVYLLYQGVHFKLEVLAMSSKEFK